MTDKAHATKPQEYLLHIICEHAGHEMFRHHQVIHGTHRAWVVFKRAVEFCEALAANETKGAKP